MCLRVVNLWRRIIQPICIRYTWRRVKVLLETISDGDDWDDLKIQFGSWNFVVKIHSILSAIMGCYNNMHCWTNFEKLRWNSSGFLNSSKHKWYYSVKNILQYFWEYSDKLIMSFLSWQICLLDKCSFSSLFNGTQKAEVVPICQNFSLKSIPNPNQSLELLEIWN